MDMRRKIYVQKTFIDRPNFEKYLNVEADKPIDDSKTEHGDHEQYRQHN
jgi:hypothetical protein